MKGLFSLPFMKKAMERRAKEAEDMARQALAEAEAEAKGIPLDEVRARTDGAATGEAGRLRFEAGKGTADGVGYDVDGAGASEDDGDGLVDMEGSGDER